MTCFLSKRCCFWHFHEKFGFKLYSLTINTEKKSVKKKDEKFRILQEIDIIFGW